jgi:hypothetical protein
MPAKRHAPKLTLQITNWNGMRVCINAIRPHRFSFTSGRGGNEKRAFRNLEDWLPLMPHIRRSFRLSVWACSFKCRKIARWS